MNGRSSCHDQGQSRNAHNGQQRYGFGVDAIASCLARDLEGNCISVNAGRAKGPKNCKLKAAALISRTRTMDEK